MNRYTIEQLKNLTENELMALTENFDERAHEFTKEEMRIILCNLENKHRDLGTEIDRVQDFIEFMGYAMDYSYEILPEQLEAIKYAYGACDDQDWKRCRFAIQTFFEYENPDAGNELDPTSWSDKHIMRWLTMLSATNLNEEPEGSPARIFFNRLSKRMESICLQ